MMAFSPCESFEAMTLASILGLAREVVSLDFSPFVMAMR
jgi:hypothetical protein